MKIKSETFVNTKPEFVLKTVFGFDTFRPLQKEIIQNVLNKKDTLAVMPTGGGKSICYQIPALILEGITVVVSPLISLMQDQVSTLEANGIHSAFLNSTLERDEYFKNVDDIKNGNIKILYISPEALATTRVRDILFNSSLKISCITIDEAHCISQWGHDFRPDYLEISTFRRFFSDAVVLALTATATDSVRQDIVKNLAMKNPQIFISSFDRPNIFLEVQQKINGKDQIINYLFEHKNESGIIYCNSRKAVDDLTDFLNSRGFSVLNYHAGLTDEIRRKNQELFIKDEISIIVATIAFGMGIDKPNVRFVINYDLPRSIEEYYQEIGRAGRDGLKSSALLLYSPNDLNKIRFFFEDSANPEQSEKLLQKMNTFATSRTCRRKALLAYFGEKYTPKTKNNNCCDICKKFGGEIPLSDMTIPVQKILCCIIRTQQKFGANYIIEVLLGSRNKRILENKHNFLSTWGIGNELSKEQWLELVDTMITNNLLIKYGEYKILIITEEGKALLQTREKVLLPVSFSTQEKSGSSFSAISNFKKSEYIVHKKAKIIAEKPAAQDKDAENLITELKKWRKRKAEDLNVPPYIIMGDKTILDLAAKKPSSKAQLKNIYGLGNVKIENFGNSLINIINDENIKNQ